MIVDEAMLQALSDEEPWDTLGEVYQTLYCRCGGVWRCHAKLHALGRELVQLMQIPCPLCDKRGDTRKVSSDPEEVVVKRRRRGLD